MRTKRVIQGLNNSQKIRVILNGVGFYMTVAETEGRFLETNHRMVVQHTLHMMVTEGCGGIGHTVTYYDGKLNKSSVQVQVDLI